jgi:hypothetical protein
MKGKLLTTLVLIAVLLLGGIAPAGAATQTEIDTAIQKGLAWLATQQNAVTGQIGSGYPLADTAVALLAFENEGNFPGGAGLYSPNVALGLDYVFQYCRITGINLQTRGNPDTNANGQGIYFDQIGGETVYETGIVMQTIVASNTPSRLVSTGPCLGMTYQQVMTDAVDWAAWAQIDDGPGRGGWRYGAYDNASAYGDNSASQWPVLGLVAAEQWGIFAPPFVKTELNIWIDYIQNDSSGGSGYDGPDSMVNIAKTGGLLVEMYYVGDANNTARAQAALAYINDHWADPPSGWDGNKGHPYAMFGVFKGLELMQVATIPNALASPETLAGDWYGDYAEHLVNAQNGDGSWNGYSSWNSWLSTGWYIVILQATVFPVEVSVDVPDCACDGTGHTVSVNYSVQRFPATGSLDVYEDDVLFASIPLVDFQGNATTTFPVASDTPGSHTWKAVLSVTGGGNSVIVKDTDTLDVCETPKVAGILDQTMPFQPFDLDNYLTYGGGLAVTWTASGVPAGWTVTIDADNVVTVVAPGGAPPADITFTASITCGPGVVCGGSDVARFTPNRPPDCSQAAPSLGTIWPANHKFVPIAVLGVTDLDGNPVTIRINKIYQDEPVNTTGDGNFTPDGKGVGTSIAEVRAERVGTPKVPGDGRFYHISFTATDPYGLACSGEVLVAVPHDQNKAPADGGPLYDSTTP